MKLSAPSHFQQILFTIVVICLLTAQSPAQQAILKQRDRPPVSGNILGVSSAGIQFQTQAGTITYPLISVESVQMAPPAEVGAAEAEFAKKNYKKALELAKNVAEKYQGLPADWAQRMSALVGDLYVVLNDLDKAEAAYEAFEKSYPSASGLLADVGRARVAAAKGDFDLARRKLEPIIAQALKDKNVPFANRIPYSGAFFVMGQVRESEKDYAGALEEYLRTVTIFYHDPTALAAAQDRAEALRTEKRVHVP